MAVGVVAGTVATTGTGSATSVTVSLTSLALTVGDVAVIAATGNCTLCVLSAPAGWTALRSSIQPANTTNMAHAIWYRVYVAGDTSSVVISQPASGRLHALPFKITGALTSAPFEGAIQTYTVNANVADGGSVPAPSVTPVDSRFLITTYALRSVATTGAANQWSQASDMVELMDNDTNNVNVTTNVCTSIAYKVLTGTSATSTKIASPDLGGQVVATSFLVEPAPTTVTNEAAAALSVTAARSATPGQTIAIPPTFKVAGIGVEAVPPVPPSPPTAAVVVEGDRRIDVAWAPPAVEGDYAVESYTLTLTSSSTDGPFNGTVLVGSPLQFAFSNLVNDRRYALQIIANSDAGPGTPYTRDVTPRAPDTPPDPPTSVQPKGLDTAVGVTWVAPVNTGSAPLSGYEVTVTQVGLGTPIVQTFGASDTSVVVTGLINGQAATIDVRAVTTAGTSTVVRTFATPTSTPVGETAPGVVGALSAFPRTGGFEASWTYPADPGSRSIYAYEVKATRDDGLDYYWLVPNSVTSGNFTGLTNNALYTVTVAAWSVAGHGTGSDVGLDLNGSPSSLGYPRYVGLNQATTVFSSVEQATEPTPETSFPIPTWYAFPPGSVFAPVNFGKDAADTTVVRVL